MGGHSEVNNLCMGGQSLVIFRWTSRGSWHAFDGPRPAKISAYVDLVCRCLGGHLAVKRIRIEGHVLRNTQRYRWTWPWREMRSSACRDFLYRICNHFIWQCLIQTKLSDTSTCAVYKVSCGHNCCVSAFPNTGDRRRALHRVYSLYRSLAVVCAQISRWHSGEML